MGCDIHVHTEVKINGRWEHLGNPAIERNYDLFALLADVRNYNEVKPIAKPRGVPDDATYLTKWDCEKWSGDAHNHSFINADEVIYLEAFIKKQYEQNSFYSMCPVEKEFGWIFGNTWAGFNEYPEDRPDGLEDIRIIFWFDN